MSLVADIRQVRASAPRGTPLLGSRIALVLVSLLAFQASPSVAEEDEADRRPEAFQDEEVYRMREYRTNYIVYGQPDTKVQFSFQFQLLKNYKLFGAFTQTMFWELGQKESNPFSEINHNPELYYKMDFDPSHFVNGLKVGYTHRSNGEDGEESRAYDALFIQLENERQYSFLLPRLEVRFLFMTAFDDPNPDLYKYYGPIHLKVYLDTVGKLLHSEEAYLQYYTGGKWGGDFSKGSVLFSLRFKVWDTETAPKFFAQYFNGYGENLLKYDRREETYRFGFSLGGY